MSPLRLLAFAALLVTAAAGCGPLGAQQHVAVSSVADAATAAQLDELERRTFDFFWDTTRADNGLAPDRWPSAPFSSVAAVGFALTAYPIGVERGWIVREQAVARTLTTLRFLYDAPQGAQATGATGYHGFFYHFLDLDSGARHAKWVELSSIDTALLLGGVLFAQSYFDRDASTEAEIRRLAEAIYARVDWPWMQVRPPLVAMGWSPEKGFIRHDWVGYNEAMLLYVLALGSPTHPLDAAAWAAWTAGYDRSWGNYGGQTHLAFAPQFGHQYSHVWVDFRGIRDDYMRQRGIDYFENSRRATYAQRAYAIANPMRWKGYGEDIWGLSASDGPQKITLPYGEQLRTFRHYSARGPVFADSVAGGFDDGTIAPTAAIASLPFAPEIVNPAMAALRARYGVQTYARYGFLDAFNPSFRYPVPLKTGRVVPGVGWVAEDYLGIDQGPILAMIENYRSGLIWRVMRNNPHVRRGLQRAGFKGGWLQAAAASEPPP